MAFFGGNQLAQARREFDAMSASAQESEQVIGRLYASRLSIYEGKFAAVTESLDQSVRADRQSSHTYELFTPPEPGVEESAYDKVARAMLSR
jgi:hypothetical protein